LGFDQIENNAVRGLVEMSDGERRVIGTFSQMNACYTLAIFD
jgi:hypothetical protein